MRFLILCLLLGCVQAIAAGTNTVEMSAEQIDHLGIRSAAPDMVSALPLIRVPGRVVLPPAMEFMVSALQSGFISHVDVPLGVKVTKNQVMAVIQSTALLDLQRAALDADSAFQVADSKLRRDDVLLREGVISRMRWQETRSDFDRAQATLRAAEQTLLASGMSPQDLANLKTNRKINTLLEVRAPTDGVVLERMAVVGQKVDALAPLFRVGRLDQLWLEVDMPQERLKEVKKGDQVAVENPNALARIIEVGQNVDPQSQSVVVRALLIKGADGLRPGMNINVQLMHRSTDRIFQVPVDSVFAFEGRNYVFVKVAAGFEARQVAVAGQEGYKTFIHEGLLPSEKIAVQGIAALKAAWLGMGESE